MASSKIQYYTALLVCFISGCWRTDPLDVVVSRTGRPSYTNVVNKVLVSACLLGRPVRYDGKTLSLDNEILSRWLEADCIIGVCPEVDAGLSVPRVAAEIVGGVGEDVLGRRAEVITSSGENVTDAFLRGANIALSLCKEHGAKVAVMTEKSPSCGGLEVYDGSFSRTKKPGSGVTVSLLRQHGIEVFNQYQLLEADRSLGHPG